MFICRYYLAIVLFVFLKAGGLGHVISLFLGLVCSFYRIYRSVFMTKNIINKIGLISTITNLEGEYRQRLTTEIAEAATFNNASIRNSLTDPPKIHSLFWQFSCHHKTLWTTFWVIGELSVTAPLRSAERLMLNSHAWQLSICKVVNNVQKSVLKMHNVNVGIR